MILYRKLSSVTFIIPNKKKTTTALTQRGFKKIFYRENHSFLTIEVINHHSQFNAIFAIL